MDNAISPGKAASPRPARRYFPRFTLTQRWEHHLLTLSFIVLLATGLPRKYYTLWGYHILTSPESLAFVRTVHLIAAVALILLALYHVGSGLVQMARGRLSAQIFPTWRDIGDFWQMIKYLLFATDRKPAYGKYSFEQKYTYWFLFFSILIMIITGLVLWFPILWTYVFPGGIVPAARLAHSTEAIVATVFLIVWHFFHVHAERLNLSIFTGHLSEEEMREYHALEYERVTGQPASPAGNAGTAETPAQGEKT